MAEHYFTQSPESAHESRSFTTVFAGRTLRFETDAGVFSKQHIDPGSELLCKSLPGDLNGRVLDMGAGWGAMSVMTMAAHPHVKMLLAEINERALELAKVNVKQNRMEAEFVQSDGFEKVDGVFDAVITNPPIRTGKAVIYKMFEDARDHLVEKGMLYLVIRKQQGAPSALKFLKGLYSSAEVIARDGGYWIIACRKGEQS